MDPKLFSLPKITLNDREEPCHILAFSNVSPHFCQMFPADRSASQEEQAVCEPGPSLQINHGPCCPSEPRLVMDEVPASLSASAAAEMHRRVANSGQIADTLSVTLRDPNQHLNPSLNLLQPQIQAVQGCPPPLHLQPVLTATFPGLIFTPCSPHDSCWVNMSPNASTPCSQFGFSSFMSIPISSPTEIWFGHHLPPSSLLLQAEVHPSWCLCPQAVQVHQPCGPHLVSRGAAQQVGEQFNVVPESAESGEEQSEEQAEAEEEQQKYITPDRNNPPAKNTDDQTDKFKVPSGSLRSLDEEWLGERAMTAVDSLSPKIQGGVKANENENEAGEDEKREKLETGNFFLLEYLDELCNNEDLIREVELKLNMEYLDSLLSSDLDSIDLLALEKQDQEVGSNMHNLDPFSSHPDPIDFLPLKELKQEPLELILQESLALSADFSSDPVTEETSPTTSRAEAPLQRAQPQLDSNRYLDEQTAPQSVGDVGSKDLLPEEPQSTDVSPQHCNLLSPTSELEAGDDDAFVGEPAATLLKSEEASVSLSNSADTQSAQTSQKLQGGPLPGDPPASDAPSTTSVSGSAEDPALTFSPPALSVLAQKTLSVQIREPEEQSSLKNTNTNPSCVEDYVPVPASSSVMVDSKKPCDPVVAGNLDKMMELVPEKQTDVSSEIRAEERGEKSEINLRTTVTQEQREEGMTTKILERKEEDEENKTKVIGRTSIRHSETQSGQTEEEKARLSSKTITEGAEERDGVIYEKQERHSSAERQLCKTEESHFEEPSRDTKTENTAEEFSETGGKEQQQILAVGMQREGQGHADNCKVSTETGAENLFTKHPQEEKELSEGKVTRKEEGIEMSSSVRRRTASTTAEGKVPATPPLPAPRAGGRIRHSEMERRELKSSPERETQIDNKQENATEPQTLLVSSPMKRRSRGRRDEEESGERTNKDKVSRICSPVTTPESSLQSLQAQTDAHSTGKSPGDEITEPPSVKTCEKNPDLPASLCAGAQKLSKTAALVYGGGRRRAGGGEARQHAVTETLGSYSLKSLKRTVNRTRIQENTEEMHQPSNPKPSPDQTAGVKREDKGINEEAGRPSPMKRYRHGRRASEEREVKVNETAEMIRSSQTKRRRWRSRAEARDGGQRLALNEKAEAEGEKASNSSAGRETFGGDKMSAIETRSSPEGTCQDKDFTLCRTKTHERQLVEEKGRTGRGRTLRSGKIFG